MGGTAVENVPGGLCDHLVAAAPAPVRPVLVGAYATALHAVRGDDPESAAWRRYAWHGVWLALPDGGARPVVDLGTRLGEEPKLPGDPGPGAWIAGRLLPDLRYWRTMLSPQFAATDPSGLGPNYRYAIGEIDRARPVVRDPVLSGHLDLLSADVAARARDWPAAATYWQRARRQFVAAGDERALAAAALVLGDLRAAPLASPLSWNCVLFLVGNAASGELAAPVEALEFAGSAPTDRGPAVEAYDDAARRYAALDDRAGSAAVDLRRGYLALIDGRPGAAVDHLRDAHSGFRATGRPLDTAVAATHLALASIADDRFPEDLGVVDDLSAARPVVGDATVFGLALLCLRVGRQWYGRQQSERATAALGLAERIWDRLGEPAIRAQTLLAASSAAAAVGDLAAARAAARRSLDADPEPLTEPAQPADGRRQRRALTAFRLYNLSFRAHDVDGMTRAVRLIAEAVEPLRPLLPRFGPVDRIIAEDLLRLPEATSVRFAEPFLRAGQARRAGDTDGAAALVDRARAAVPALPPEERDLCEALLHRFDGADRAASDAFDRYVRRTIDAVPTSDLTTAFPGLAAQRVRQLHEEGLIWQLTVGNAERARAHRDALAATATPWWAGLDEEWRFHGYDGRLRELEGDLAGALSCLDRAVAGAESARADLRRDASRTAFSADVDVRTVHLDAARVAMLLAETTDGSADHWRAVAFGYAERAQSRALLDLVRGGRQAAPETTGRQGATLEAAGLPPDLVARWRAANAEVSLAEARTARAQQVARLDTAVERLRAVEDELRRADPRFWAAISPRAESVPLPAVTEALPAGATLLQFAVGERDLIGWAVTRDGIVATSRFAGEHGLAGLVARTVDGCAGGGDHHDSARRLADLLLEPLRAVLAASTSVLVVPGGPLMALPFDVLPFDGAPLGDTAPVTVLPTAGLLVTDRRTSGPARTGPALVVGDPVGMTCGAQEAPPLPGARIEAAAVAGLLPDARLLLGADATLDRVTRLMRGARVVHFATHGVLDTDSPLGSAILLARGQNLTAARLFGVDLDADLVVLSACHTGAGEAVGGGELLGLGRAIIAAGVRTVVVTRWAVDDLSATLFMAEFHRRRLTGEPDPQALRSAARYLRTLDRATARSELDRLAALPSAPHPGAVVASARCGGTVRDLPAKGRRFLPYGHPYHWAAYALVSAG